MVKEVSNLLTTLLGYTNGPFIWFCSEDWSIRCKLIFSQASNNVRLSCSWVLSNSWRYFIFVAVHNCQFCPCMKQALCLQPGELCTSCQKIMLHNMLIILSVPSKLDNRSLCGFGWGWAAHRFQYICPLASTSLLRLAIASVCRGLHNTI